MTKVKNVLTAAVTYISIAQAVLLIFSNEIAAVFPGNETVATLIVRVGVVLTAVVSIIRRVTPVLRSQRGLG